MRALLGALTSVFTARWLITGGSANVESARYLHCAAKDSKLVC